MAEQLRLPRPRCQEALEEAGGDAERALRALLKTGEVDPAALDPQLLPDWAFTEAQLARTRAMMGEMAIPDELQGFFEATLGQVGAEDRRRAELRDAAPSAQDEDEATRGLMGRRLKDPEFGGLEWNEGWTGRARLGGFYGHVPLRIEAPEGRPPEDPQREAYRSLGQLDDRFRGVLEALLVGFYQGLRTARPEKLEPLGEMQDIWQALDGPVMVLPRQPPGARRVELHFWRVGGGSRRIEVVLVEGRLRGLELR